MEIYNDKQKENLKQYSKEELLSPRSNANWEIKKVISVGIGLVIAGVALHFLIRYVKNTGYYFDCCRIIGKHFWGLALKKIQKRS